MNQTFELTEQLFPEMVQTRRHIHQNPELSFEEYKTHAFICERLSKLGIEYKTVATTGVVAHIGKGNHCVALRADIDALPILEETGLEYSSTTPGVMHACGHDTHTTMLLTAAEILKLQESELPGVVKLLFQPGEEKVPGGATMLIAEGALENPKPSFVFGQHINPAMPAGALSFVSGPMLASADELYITIRGFGAHAAQPHLGKDPIMAASALILHLQQLITKHRNPLNPAVITITSIHGGSATNIIPDVVELKGTLRSFDETWRRTAWSFIEEQTMAFCALYGCEAKVTISKGYPPLINNAEATTLAREVATTVFGSELVSDFEPKMWAEDFAYYTQIIPSCFWMLGGKPQGMESMPGLHNAKFAPEESAMKYGATMLVEVAKKALHQML